MRAYSPYENVAAVPYPAMLATAGLDDPESGTTSRPSGSRGCGDVTDGAADACSAPSSAPATADRRAATTPGTTRPRSSPSSSAAVGDRLDRSETGRGAEGRHPGGRILAGGCSFSCPRSLWCC